MTTISNVNSQTITAQLAQQITRSSPGSSIVTMAAARQGVLDFLASAFAGATDHGLHKLKKIVQTANGPQASVIGMSHTTDILNAALLNGYAGHALDYDDVHGCARGHPSTVLLPALFAIAEGNKSSALRLLEAYIVGIETMARLGIAMGEWHYDNGFHQTSTLGCIGVAAAASFLLDLDPTYIENALGLATTQAFGLRHQFGTEIKPLHAGLAARSGLFAVQLSQGDLLGARGCFDSPIGFLNVFGGNTANPKLLNQDWGNPWKIDSPGLYFKPYPCCIASHYAADATLILRSEHKIDPNNIASIEVTFPLNGDQPLQIKQPKTGLEGRFSVEYVISAALIDGLLSTKAFLNEPIRHDISELTKRVTRKYDHESARASANPTARFSRVDIKLKNGKVLSHRIDNLHVSIDLRAKFNDATAGNKSLEDVPDLIESMHSSDDLIKLTSLFRVL